ncbi:hypothetical protein DITRI_Ditri20bG0081500 [Diplodiscus trichospermus]
MATFFTIFMVTSSSPPFLSFKPLILIASNSLAHKALIVKGAIFADRPAAVPPDKFLTSDQHNINWAFYGPTWLHLRRNLTSNILQPVRIRSFACARKWVMNILINRLKPNSFSDDQIEVIEHIPHALFCLLAFMCFGDKLEGKQIQDIKNVQRPLQMSIDNFKILNLFPCLGKFFFYKHWQKLRQLRKDQENAMVPFIRARKATKEQKYKEHKNCCSTDTTSTALQWILGYLVKNPHIQEKLFMEIKEVIGNGEIEIKEVDLQKMPYLKAVVLEGLRRHPPSHFLVPHAVTKDVELDGFLVPKNSIVTFMVAEIGRDPKIWENPMEFKPERFLNGEHGEAFDITGSREIKMMPFGVGRRMCPAYGLELLHLEFFVANLVWHFNWVSGSKGNDVDFSEKYEFTTVMKNSLKVRITPRLHFQ